MPKVERSIRLCTDNFGLSPSLVLSGDGPLLTIDRAGSALKLAELRTELIKRGLALSGVLGVLVASLHSCFGRTVLSRLVEAAKNESVSGGLIAQSLAFELVAVEAELEALDSLLVEIIAGLDSEVTGLAKLPIVASARRCSVTFICHLAALLAKIQSSVDHKELVPIASSALTSLSSVAALSAEVMTVDGSKQLDEAISDVVGL